MIFKLFPFQNEIVLSEEYVSIFQINNKRLFNRVANSLYLLSIGQPGDEDIIFVDGDKKVDFQEEGLFLSDLWHFDHNNKKIISKLFAFIEENYKMDTELMESFQQQIQLIQAGIREITDELPFNVEIKQVIILQDVLKMLGIKLEKMEGYSLIERALTILEIVEQFKLCSVIVLCNVKNYLDENELLELYKHALHCKIKLLIIDYGEPEKLILNEKIWYIDEDYEEFRY